MILPAGYEEMTDEEIVASLIEAGAYEPEAAQAVVDLVRSDEAI